MKMHSGAGTDLWHADGTMKLISIVDPLFVALPILERARGQVRLDYLSCDHCLNIWAS